MKTEKSTLSYAISVLTLFSSLSTLLCCALPALLVSVGAGAAVIGLVSTVPQLIWLSEHKVGLFIVSGVILLLSWMMRHVNRNAPCPIEPKQAKACQQLRRINSSIFMFSASVYAVGFFFAFIARYIF